MPNGIESTLMLLIAASLVCVYSVWSCTKALGRTLPLDTGLQRGPKEETCAFVVRAAVATGTPSAGNYLHVLKGYWGAAAALALVTTVVALNAVGDTPPTMWTRGADGVSHLASCRPSYDTWFARTCLLGGCLLFGYTMFMRLRLTGLITEAYAAGHFGAPRSTIHQRAESWIEQVLAARRKKALEPKPLFVDSLFDPLDEPAQAQWFTHTPPARRTEPSTARRSGSTGTGWNSRGTWNGTPRGRLR